MSGTNDTSFIQICFTDPSENNRHTFFTTLWSRKSSNPFKQLSPFNEQFWEKIGWQARWNLFGRTVRKVLKFERPLLYVCIGNRLTWLRQWFQLSKIFQNEFLNHLGNNFVMDALIFTICTLKFSAWELLHNHQYTIHNTLAFSWKPLHFPEI